MTARWAVRAATWPARRRGESHISAIKEVQCFGMVPLFSSIKRSYGIRTGAVLNDSPVGCQSCDLARPQAWANPTIFMKDKDAIRCNIIFRSVCNQ